MNKQYHSGFCHYRDSFHHDYSETHRGRQRDRLRRRLGKVWKQRQTRDRKNTLLLTACLWLDVFASWKLFCWVDRARNYSLLANSTLHYGRRLWEQHTTWALRLHIIQRERDSKSIPYMWCVSTKLTQVAVLITHNILILKTMADLTVVTGMRYKTEYWYWRKRWR